MRFINDDGIVSTEKAVGLAFCQQNAVSHQLDVAFRRGFIIETHFIADMLSDPAMQFFSNSFGY